jgi:glycerol kinase
MNTPCILAIDQGTTSTRAILFNGGGEVIGASQRPHRQIYPQPGWVSHNACEIYQNVLNVTRQAIATGGVSPQDIKALGITNQRETMVLWDKTTGEPVSDAVVWQCKRTADICAQMEADGMAGIIRAKTGLLIDPYFSATKIKWMLDNIPAAKDLMGKNRLLAGTVDSFLIWKLTGGKRHVTDYTNASRTLLFNIHTLAWDADIIEYFGIDRKILPEVVPSAGIAGYTDAEIFGAEIPIAGIAGDQHSALFGQTCFSDGDVKNTYGTGCFILKNIGEKPIVTESKLLTTLAWYIDGKAWYALEGSIFNAGAAIEWLIREMKLADSVEEINEICAKTPDTGGVYFIPAFTGLGAPFWDRYARGTLCGISLSTGKRQIIRAVMESVAFRSRDVIDHMNEVSGPSGTLGASRFSKSTVVTPGASGSPVATIKVDGGVSRSDFVMQFQADLLRSPIERPRFIETTARGAFYLAGLGAGLFRNLSDIRRMREVERVFEPAGDAAETEEQYAMWKRAVERSRDWLA